MVIVLRTGLLQTGTSLIHRNGPEGAPHESEMSPFSVDTGIVVASVFLETLTMMAVGACIAVLVLAISYSHHWTFFLTAVALAVAAGLPTLPPVFSRLARLLGVGRASPGVAEKLAGFDYRTLVSGWLVMALGWIAMGGSLWAMLRGLDYDADWPRLWQLYTAIVAMAVVGGFASLIPAGLVSREAVFTVMLAPLPSIGTNGAVTVAVALRLTWLLAELLISAILYCAGWLRRGVAKT